MAEDQTPTADTSLQLTGKPDANGMYALHLSQEELAAFANNGGGSIQFGPVLLTYNYTLVPLMFQASASISGFPIGSVTLDTTHPTLSIGGSKFGFTVKLDLTLNVAAKSVHYHIVIKTPFGTILDKQGDIKL